MKSVTYNVVITKSPQVTDKLFFDKFGRQSFEERFSSLNAEEKRDLLLVAPQRNNNFISFEIDFPTAQGGRYAVLKVLESDRILEYFAMAKTANDQLIRQRANIIKGFRDSNALFDAAARLSPSFYISYGVGDDVSKWAGPYMVDMIDANITMTEDNVRQLELMFQPLMTSQFVFTNKGFNDVLTAQKYSVFDGTLNADQDIEMISKLTFPVKNNKLSIGNLGGERRFNYAVRALVKRYLADRFQIPFGNVLCLFDDDFGFLDKNLIEKNISNMNRSLGRCGMSMSYNINLDKLGSDVRSEVSNVGQALVRLSQRFNQTGELLKSKKAVQKQLTENSDEIKDLENGILENAYPALLVSNTVKSDVASTLAGTSTLGATPEAVVANKYFIYEKGALPAAQIPSNVSKQEVKRRQQLGVRLVSNQSDFSGPEANRIRQRASKLIGNRRKVLNGTGASPKDDESPEERAARLGLKQQVRVGKARSQSPLKDIGGLFRDSFGIIKNAVYNSNIDKMIETDYTEYNEVNLSIGTILRPGDVSDTDLAALKPLYKLVESVGELREFKDKQIKDFDILEENNYKILKTLYKNGLIESDSKPVIIFGRDRIIQALLYPDNDQELLFKTLGGKADLIFSEMAGTQADDYRTKKEFFVENEKDLKNQPGANLDEITSYRQTTTNRGYSNQKTTKILFTSESSVLGVLDAFKTYQKEFLGLVKDLKGPITSSFEEKMDFGPSYQSETETKIKGLKAPLVFMSNTKNANVLDLSFDSSPYKGVLLNMGYESGFRLLDETSNVEEIISDDTVDNPSLRKLLKTIETTVIDRDTKKIDLSKLSDKTVRKVVLKVVASEGEVGNSSIKSLLDFILFKYATNSSFTRKTEPGNVGVQNANIYKNINRYVIGANVRTLPFFNTTIIPGRDCYLFGLPNQVIGNNQDLREIAAPAIFTNSYKIAGVKHKISFDQAFSEFDLLPGELGLGSASEDKSVIEFFRFTEEEIEQTKEISAQEAAKRREAQARAERAKTETLRGAKL